MPDLRSRFPVEAVAGRARPKAGPAARLHRGTGDGVLAVLDGQLHDVSLVFLDGGSLDAGVERSPPGTNARGGSFSCSRDPHDLLRNSVPRSWLEPAANHGPGTDTDRPNRGR